MERDNRTEPNPGTLSSKEELDMSKPIILTIKEITMFKNIINAVVSVATIASKEVTYQGKELGNKIGAKAQQLDYMAGSALEKYNAKCVAREQAKLAVGPVKK
jgi:hypothetical protein